MNFDRWGPNDEYPDDPDFECNDCGHCFDKPWPSTRSSWNGKCPECGSNDIHGGGYYG